MTAASESTAVLLLSYRLAVNYSSSAVMPAVTANSWSAIKGWITLYVMTGCSAMYIISEDFYVYIVFLLSRASTWIFVFSVILFLSFCWFKLISSFFFVRLVLLPEDGKGLYKSWSYCSWFYFIVSNSSFFLSNSYLYFDLSSLLYFSWAIMYC